MRVTKTVKEYIQKKVQERLEPRYQAEIDQWADMRKRRDDFITGIINAGEKAMEEYVEAHKGEVSDFLRTTHTKHDLRAEIGWNGFDYLNKEQSAHCSHASSRLTQEAAEKTNSIIVEMELGGNKADLERLLAEI